MKPFMTLGIDYEPIHWVLISHIQEGDMHRYEYRASSIFEGYSYSLKVTNSPDRLAQHFTIVF